MTKLLILGASGSIGKRLFARLGVERALATFNRQPVAGGVHFDLLTMRVANLVKGHDIRHAAVLFADSQPDSCIADQVKSRALNVTAMERLLTDLADCGIKPIFTSTEFVFDGETGEYDEDSLAEPILLYGQQKKEVEEFLASESIPHAVLRLAKVFGDVPGDGTLFTGWLDAILNKGQTRLKCAKDQAFSPVFVEDVCDSFIKAAHLDISGLFHCSGNRRFTRLELLTMLLEKLRARTKVDVEVEPCSIRDFALAEKRPVDVSMRADKLARTLGIQFDDIEARVVKIVDRALGPAS